MRKILKILILLGLPLSVTGCVHDNYDECAPKTVQYNVSLEFSLRDDGVCVFDSIISTVELCIFNGDGIPVLTKHIPRTELDEFRGIKLTLDPGLYHVVGWGNIGSNAYYHGSQVTYVNINSGRVTNAGKVYYAPKNGDLSGAYPMWVDPVTGHAGVLEYTAAHRTVRIYIEGYDGTPGVELLHVPQGLAWLGMKWLGDTFGSKLTLTASNTTTPLERENVWYDYVAFDTFYFGEDNDIILNIVDHSTNESVFHATLNEMFEGAAFPTGIISVVVRFTPAGVEVGIPYWESHEVDPGLG